MISLETSAFLGAFIAVAVAWLLPRPIAMDGVAAWTFGVMALLSWETTAWLAAATIATPLVLKLGDRLSRRGGVAMLWAAVLIAAFVYAQLAMTAIFIGSAYFTLRLLHVVAEWWMGRIDPPTVRAHWRYQFFLPVMVVGPIQRLPNFQRQIERRRWDTAEFLTGAERALLGFFLAAVPGEYIMLRAKLWVLRAFDLSDFMLSWILSALDWIALYFVFAGLSAAALGISLMAGLRLEENFNQPWRASSLIDFWTRWHMTLTSWCRDYVFVPVMALSRSPLFGLVCAMLVIGLWHRLSLYYVLWGFWQSAGVVLNRLASRSKLLEAVPRRPMRLAAPLMILGWLSLARPVLGLVLEGTS
jgi:alginate O-acetyltransferase complex protein AlgI